METGDYFRENAICFQIDKLHTKYIVCHLKSHRKYAFDKDTQHSQSRFPNVKISSRSKEKVDFRPGFSIESYAKMQKFMSLGAMTPFLWPFENCSFR